MPNKRKKAYSKAFKGLKKAMDNMGLPGLLAKWVMSDFESNIKSQFQKVFPGIPWRHCLFHFVKALMRQVTSLKKLGVLQFFLQLHLKL